jgi:hypothetical protein
VSGPSASGSNGETSAREAVSAVVTLSEEDGRMAVLADGSDEDSRRGAFEERPVRD